MPIKDVSCANCETVVEYFLKINEEPKECKTCKSKNIKVLVGAPGIRLKGTGWYVTDFKSQGKKAQDNLSERHRSKLYGDDE